MITRKMRLSMAMLTIAASVLTTGNIKADEKDTTNETNTATESKYANKAVADIYSTTTLNIRKKGSINAKIVGKMKKGNIATVLKKGSEWSKVRSGNVTGYVKNQYLVFGDEIENFAKQNVKKVAKVQTETLRVRKKASTDSKIVTLVSEDDKLKVKKQTNDWAKVKVDGQTGYVSKDYAKVTYSFGKAKSMKQIQAEQEAKEAKKRAEEAARSKSENESVSTTSSGHTSDDGTTSGSTTGSTQTTKKASVSVSSSGSSATGSRIASYAQQFVGNPYRYGGNSLTNGIDCSGFTQQIMAKFGYSISRTSSSQSGDGRAVSTSNLRAGDLVFYGDGGSIDHVALYIGGGQVVHASNSAPYPRGGIKISNVNYRTPICARRIQQKEGAVLCARKWRFPGSMRRRIFVSRSAASSGHETEEVRPWKWKIRRSTRRQNRPCRCRNCPPISPLRCARSWQRT